MRYNSSQDMDGTMLKSERDGEEERKRAREEERVRWRDEESENERKMTLEDLAYVSCGRKREEEREIKRESMTVCL